MIIDTSAVVAIFFEESERFEFADVIGRTSVRKMSAATVLESYIVIDRRGDATARGKFDSFIMDAITDIVPFTAEHARIARRAYQEFGKGSGHRAGLNLGDCFAYALAKQSGEALLFKGDDFGHTDIVPAL